MLFKLLHTIENKNLKESQISSLINIVNSDENILNYETMLRFGKAAAYLTFFIKEVYEFWNVNSEDRQLIFQIRSKNLEVENLKKEKDNLDCILKKHI